jgi:hypothetical protein
LTYARKPQGKRILLELQAQLQDFDYMKLINQFSGWNSNGLIGE